MHEARGHLDFETGSPQPLVGPSGVGVHRYAEDPRTRVWGFSWGLGDGLVFPWRPGQPAPVKLLEHIRNGGTLVAHNAMFERVMWRYLRHRYGLTDWPELKASQQVCTMAKALAMNLPAGLDDLSKVIGVGANKDMEGNALMKRMAKPSKIHPDGTCEWALDTPENRNRIEKYQTQDVVVEIEVDEVLPDLVPREQALWVLDQEINDRGLHIDIASVTRAMDLVDLAKRNADARMTQITDGAVRKVTEVGKLLAWVKAQGIECTSVKKGDQDDIIASSKYLNMPRVVEAIELRRDASKTSTAKYKKFSACVCEDNRIRGTLQYHGAAPGRWAGRLIQPQNLPRVDPDRDGPLVERVIYWLTAPVTLQDAYTMIYAECGPVLAALSKALRGMILAAPGARLLGGDFANIEGRINAWLAGEAWKLAAFEAYDAKTGPDLYKLAYSRAFGVAVEFVEAFMRQIGKVMELALGYQGGVGAFITMGDTYNVKPEHLVKPVQAAAGAYEWDRVAAKFRSARDKFDLPEDQWTAIKIIVLGWRAAHPEIVNSWWELADAAVSAVLVPNVMQHVYSGRVTYLCDGEWLYCRLPSGRIMHYARPEVREEAVVKIKIDSEWIELERMGLDFFKGNELYDIIDADIDYAIRRLKEAGFETWKHRRNVVYYLGRDSKTGSWHTRYLYGGLQCENIVQGTARCVMDHAMFRAEAAGYPLILTVHDELLAELDKQFGSKDHFKGLMAVREDWYADLPIAVSAWEDERYVK